MLVLGGNDNTSKYFKLHKDQKYILDEQNIEEDHRNLVGKSLDFESYVRDSLSESILQNGFFANELS